MKGAHGVLRASGPLLVFGGLALAQGNADLQTTMIETSTDPIQGGFRTFMQFTVGDQTIKGLLDTGSSDLTVQRSGSNICKEQLEQCDGNSKTGQVFGAFDPNKGQVQVKQLNVPLNATFTGGAAFEGEFVQAPFQVSAKSSVDLQMGLIETGNGGGGVIFPVIGVGPIEGESTIENNITYPNLPARLKEAGAIKANAFGLYLGDFRSPDNGSLVWGGFDAAKFDGDLQKVNIERDNAGQMPSFVVNLASVGVTNMNGGGQGGSSAGNRGSQQSERGGNNNAQVNRTGGNSGEQGGRLQGNETAAAPKRRSVWGGRTSRLDPRHSYKRSIEPLSEHELQKRQQNGNLLKQQGQVVLVDTGDPTLTLPLDTVEALAGMLDAQPDEKTGFFRVDCKRIEGMALTFGMNNDNVKVNVPMEVMVLGPEFDQDLPAFLQEDPAGGQNAGQGSQGGQGGGGGSGGGNTAAQGQGNASAQVDRNAGGNQGSQGAAGGNGANGNRGCQLPIVPIEGDEPLSIFGSPAMQAMYVVFDMDSQSLMFAQARLNETKTDLREIAPSNSGGSQAGAGARAPGAGGAAGQGAGGGNVGQRN